MFDAKQTPDQIARPNTNTNTNTIKFPTGKQIQISDHVMWQIQSFFSGYSICLLSINIWQ